MTGPAAADSRAGHTGKRRCLLILNEWSRTGAAARGPVLEALRAGGAALASASPLPPEGLENALDRLETGALDRILVGGGDGTLNAVLPALLRARVPVGVLPLGTANDFAGALGIPSGPREAVRVALEGRLMRVDVGRVNGAPFLNVASLGLGAQVTEDLSAELKARLGFLGYPRAMLGAYRKALPFRARIRSDGYPPRRMRCIHLAVGNGPRYGGGALIAEDARLDDGRLHLFALAPVPLWRLILLAPWLGLGRQRDLSDALTRKATRLWVETSRPLPISADGEIIASTPAAFDLLPGALQVLVPKARRREDR
jgi:YegS/Rv2252/BmrU family lipid kinase